MLRVIAPQNPDDLSEEDVKAGKGNGWDISRGGGETPAGYEHIFRDLNIPLGSYNVGRRVYQLDPFRNWHRQHNVRPSLLFPWFSSRFSRLREK